MMLPVWLLFVLIKECKVFAAQSPTGVVGSTNGRPLKASQPRPSQILYCARIRLQWLQATAISTYAELEAT